MIEVEYIVDKDKSLLTIYFDKALINRMKAKCDEYLNLYQSVYNLSHITIFKADTGYRITRAKKQKKKYQITVRHPLHGLQEFDRITPTCYLKKNGSLKFVLKEAIKKNEGII